MMAEPFWDQVTGSALRQGHYLPKCLVPRFSPDFDGASVTQETQEVEVYEFDLIVLTQSCDLENSKARFVAMSPLYAISEFKTLNPAYANKGKCNEVRKGRIEGLHLLASPEDPSDNQKALIVDFREIYSLPFGYLEKHAANIRPRWRLRSPFLEHFSQTFARFFMRVGLPSSVPEFK
jgi:hypothetical protein